MAAHSDDSFTVEERLFAKMLSGSPASECDALLGRLDEVDRRGGMMRGRTLLHVAVHTGMVDWAERLLGMGADPVLADGDGMNVVRVADDMCTLHQDDHNRKEILRMVRMVHRRDSSSRGALASGVLSESSLVIPSGREFTPEGCRTVKEQLENETRSSMVKVLESLDSRVTSLMEEFRSIREELKSRDVILSALESGVTSLVDRFSSPEEETAVLGGRPSARETAEETETVPIGEEEAVVDAMVRATAILDPDEIKASRVRGFYRRIQSASPLTSCILLFLSSQPRLRVNVDCDSVNIARMKGRSRDHDGLVRDGSHFHSYADLVDCTAYSGLKVEGDWTEDKVAGYLAKALCELALSLTFKNGGRPYSKGDLIRRGRMEVILDEAGRRNERGEEGVDWRIFNALARETEEGSEMYLTSIVPWVIAELGEEGGLSLLREQLPSLLSYYEDHVMLSLWDNP